MKRLNGDGVDGLGNTGGEDRPPRIGIGRVLRPRVAVEQLDRVVVKHGGRGDGSLVQCRGIGCQRLHRGAYLPGQSGVVGQKVALFLPHGTHHGHDIAGGGINDGDAGLELLAVAGGDVQIAAVAVDFLRDVLNLRVHGGIDVIAAVVDPQQRLVLGDLQLLRQIGGHVPDHLIHKPVVDLGAAGGLFHQILGRSGAVRELQHLVLGGLSLFLRQEGLSRLRVLDLGHLVQDPLLTLLVQLPGRDGGAVLPGDGDVGHGTIQGGIVGDGDQTGALRHTQLAEVLAEVILCRRLDAVAALPQVDEVEVHLQDVGFGVVLFKLQRPEDLPDFPVDGGLVVLGHVADHLLGNGGPAVGVVAGEHVQRRADGPLPVHTVVGEEPFVLNGHGGLPQCVGHVLEIRPDAVFGGMDGLVLLPLAAVLILIINNGALAHVVNVVLRPDIQRGCQGGLYIHHENARHHQGRAKADQNHRADNELDGPAAASSCAFFLMGFPAPRRPFRRCFPFSVLQCRAPPFSGVG